MRCGGTQGGVGPPGGVLSGHGSGFTLSPPSPLPPFLLYLPPDDVCPQRWSWGSPSSTPFLGGRGPSLTILGSCC